jgi:hypothetical protein
VEDASSSRSTVRRCHRREEKVLNLSTRPNFSTSTLMPPPHHFLAPRLRGYVCRACLFKSQVPRRQPPLWLSRNASNDRGPPQSKGVIKQVDLPEPEIREFEQTADGTRIEIRDNPLKEIEDEIRDIERQEGKSIEELVGPFDFESFLENDGEQISYDPIMGDSMAAVTKRTEELKAMVERINSISDFSTLSTEDRSKLREELLNSVTAGIFPLWCWKGSVDHDLQMKIR